MKAVLQRVSAAGVSVDGVRISQIDRGILVLLGVEQEDTEEDVKYLAEKVINLRIFEDAQDKMNLCLKDVGGQLLVVSQFTLLADCRKGRRPSFDKAGKPELAQKLYNSFIDYCVSQGIETQGGNFQAHMLVNIANDGPVTMLLDSKKNF